MGVEGALAEMGSVTELGAAIRIHYGNVACGI